MLPSRHLFSRAIYYSKQLGLTYINNPKVACSSIKQSLWIAHDNATGEKTFHGNMAKAESSPIFAEVPLTSETANEISACTKFSVVRNPYSRALSAYLDKICGSDRDLNTWTLFAKTFNLALDSQISFVEFLGYLAESNINHMDAHFAPQTLTTMCDFLRYEHIGYLEEISETQAYLNKYGITIQNYTPHTTNAAERLHQYYTSDAIELVQKIYATDFQRFNYSGDIKRLSRLHDFTSISPENDRFLQISDRYKLPVGIPN